LMEWRDAGFVLAARRHGESGAIVELLTREHGRHAGLVRGGQSSRLRAMLQPGNEVAAVWRGRLAEHLGTIVCEIVRPYASRILDDPDRLAALTAAAALVAAALPEREPHPDVFALFSRLLEALDSRADWDRHYVGWECDLLAAAGFGLDLGCCAVTGVTTDLAYVSPRTGRAVSRAAGLPYRDKLLALPEFLWRDEPADRAQIALGMSLTEHFLVRHIFRPQGRTLPAARLRLAERMREPVAAATMSVSSFPDGPKGTARNP
jgi:DNA repair protein RecO (recombination protein O)